MTWRGFGKVCLLIVLLAGGVIALWYGMALTLFGRAWYRLLGVGLFVGSFRGIILAFDLMWGRPPVFSKRPWERPWEQASGPETRRPPGW